MITLLKSQMIKLALAFMIMLILLLSFLIQDSQANALFQTIPTAPPTTAIPPISPTKTPTNPPQPTVIYIQPTRVQASLTPSSIASPTIEKIISSPTNFSTSTELTGIETLPILTITQTPTLMTQMTPSSALLPTTTVFPATKTTSSTGILYGLLGGGIVLIFISVVVWFLKSRHKEPN
jgi:hypothetical protein